jgi:hypothetical protein
MIKILSFPNCSYRIYKNTGVYFLMFQQLIQSRKYPLKGDTIQYIYTDSKHNNPLCRVTSIENIQSLTQYDKEKYKEMILDAAETALGFFGFDRTVYSNLKKGRSRWYEELKEQRARDIETEMI